MSIQTFIRHPDGTGFEGRVAFNFSEVRANNLAIRFQDNAIPPIEDIYQLYGVSSETYIVQTQKISVLQLDSVYRFFYGHSYEELMEVEVEQTYSRPGMYYYQPKEWTVEMVQSMDWDMFCLSYYIFLCSTNDYKTKVWKVLEFILHSLKNNPGILSDLLRKSGRNSDESACFDFWETVCDGLKAKSLGWLCEKTCYNAFYSMITVRPFFSNEKYSQFESTCFEVLDRIARTRINDAFEKTYTIRELQYFSIEELFFYKDFFAESDASEDTKRYVMNKAFTLLYSKADKAVAVENALSVDEVYKGALKYAQTEEDIELIATKRKKISSEVAKVIDAQIKARKEAEKELKEKLAKQKKKDKVTSVFATILLIIFLISIITTILFGIFALSGVLLPTSRIVFFVSLCIMVAFLIFIVNSYKKN